jgi:predicted  nucleic acid-binding Zn-ribbon protein
MNLVKKLYELQTIDLEIRRSLDEIEGINRILANNELIDGIKQASAVLKKSIADLNVHKKGLEFEIDEISQKASQISTKLYGGTVKNPKELLSLEQDLTDQKKRLNLKEDALLEVMEEAEKLNTQKVINDAKLHENTAIWEVESEKHKDHRDKLEHKLDELKSARKLLINEINADTLKSYERLMLKKGLAVARVEQGRCQGCRISLPVQQLQLARSGPVFCSSCGMILYLS